MVVIYKCSCKLGCLLFFACFFQPSLRFVSKCKNTFQALAMNIRLNWKGLPATNTLTNQDKLAAGFCHQVAAWVPDMF